MQKQNYTTSNFTRESGGFQLFMPINVSMLVPEHDSVRLLSQIVEELDLYDLNLAYSSKGRNPAVPPIIMLKILLYAYMNGVYSSREIETRCRRDINFMWLLQGYQAPDHNTIARFRTGRLKNSIEGLFSQFITKLHHEGEVPFENAFIDGTKIEADANKYSFVWKGSVEKLEVRLPEKVEGLLERINHEYGTMFKLSEEDALLGILREATEYLIAKKDECKVVFVSGKGKHKSELQRLIELSTELMEKKARYRDYMGEFTNRNSFSKTDRDATFMHMKEDHMRNSQLKPGYNFQIAVENGYVTCMDISEERSDMYTLIPMLERLKSNFPKNKFYNIVADAGYESEENYNYLSENGYGIYIKPATYESQKKRSYKKWIGRKENMEYDANKDEYICAKGRRLKPIKTKIDTQRRSKYAKTITVYQCENCNHCGMKSRCKKSENPKRIDVSKDLVRYREQALSNITSDKGIILRVNRSIQVEGAFGMMKEDYGFRRFLTRGKQNVSTECLLMCFSYDINKLYNKIMGRGNKEILYEPQAA